MGAYRDILNRLKTHLITADISTFFVTEHTMRSDIKTAYQTLGSLKNFMAWLEEMAQIEDSGFDYGSIIRGIGGVGSG